MRFVRLALVFAAVLIAAAMSEAQPRPIVRPNPTPLAVMILNGIDDPVVVADLKLKDEQVKALVAYRTKLWDEAYITAPRKLTETAVDRTATTDMLLKKTLTEEQYKRATQLGAQSVLRTPNFGSTPDSNQTFRLANATVLTFNRYPELVIAFKLTDDQKKMLTTTDPTPFGRSITMTKEQAATAKEFLGPIVKTWQDRIDPRRSATPSQPGGLYLLEAKDVRAELKLPEETAKVFADINEKWQKLSIARRTDLSPKEADAQAAVLKSESEKAFDALSPGAARRLKQITFQMDITNSSRFGGGFLGGGGSPTRLVGDFHIDRLYTNATVVKEVVVTEQQTKEFKAIWEAFEKAAGEILTTADQAATAEKKINELIARRREKAETVLTANQTEKLTELVGKPFSGNTRPDRIGRLGGFPEAGPTLALEAARAAQFGKYTTEFTLLAGNKAVQEELKLTPEQIKKVGEIRDEIQSQYRIAVPREGNGEQYAKAYTERSKIVEEALGKLLTEEQAKRFRQLMLQSRERGRSDRSYVALSAIRSAVSYPGVAEAVKLTEEQKKKLLIGTAPDDVLTAEQKNAIKEMLGAPYKGNSTTASETSTSNPFARTPADARRYSTFGNHTTELSELADNKAVQDELKLSPEQIKKATEFRDEVAKIVLPGLSSRTVEEYAKAYTERSKAVGEAIAKVLDKDQARRFREIMMRFRETPNNTPVSGWVASAVSYPGTAEMVKLTDDQRVKLITGTIPANVLTDDQKSAIAKMLGKPFKGAALGFVPLVDRGPALSREPNITLVRLISTNKQNVVEALKLAPEQAKKLDVAWTTYQTAIETLSPPTRPDQVATINQQRSTQRANFEKAVQELLTEEQKMRLAQFLIQANAAQSLVAALTSREVAKQLELTKEQTDKLRTLSAEATRLQNLRATHLSADTRGSPLGLRIRDAADERMMAVLSDDQKKKWKELIGEPLPGLTKTVSPVVGGFGPGGPGGLGSIVP